MNIRSKIREIKDWPKKGINFKDITPLLEDPKAFKHTVNSLIKPYLNKKIDKVVAIDARGFILASPIAYKLNAGICLIRKKGKLPYKVAEVKYEKEYGEDFLTIHKDSIKKGEKVIIIDDVLATGGTMEASVKLVEKLGGKIVGISVLIDLLFLNGSKKFNKYNFYSLISYDK